MTTITSYRVGLVSILGLVCASLVFDPVRAGFGTSSAYKSESPKLSVEFNAVDVGTHADPTISTARIRVHVPKFAFPLPFELEVLHASQVVKLLEERDQTIAAQETRIQALENERTSLKASMKDLRDDLLKALQEIPKRISVEDDAYQPLKERLVHDLDDIYKRAN